MASFFGTNPFSTPVGQRIEQATIPDMASENWALNMEICDIINETDEGPKDAVKAIRKKLTMNAGKNYTVVMYTLTVLETCVKNCGRRFHLQIATKDFLGEMIKIIGPKYDPPTIVQEKILSMIQTWADAFRGSADLKDVEKCYQDLKSKGIEFPMTDLDSLAPIHTPARTSGQEPDPAVQTQRTPQRVQSSRAGRYAKLEEDETAYQASSQQQPPPQPIGVQPGQQVAQQIVTGPVNPSPEQLAKLRSELDIVMGNIRVFGEMLTEMTPGQENREDLELLQELNRTCRAMQQRIQGLLQQVGNEEVLEELLRVNDDLNNVFVRYDRFERYRTSQPTAAETAEPTMAAPPPPYPGADVPAIPPPAPKTQPETARLISFGEEPSQPAPVPQPTAISSDPFDTSNIQAQVPQPTAISSDPFDTSSIQAQVAGMNISGTANPDAGVINSDEFDMFAQSRQSFEQNKQQLPQSTYTNQQSDSFGGGLGAAVNAKTTPYGDNLLDKDSELGEMEDWLSKNKEIPGKETATSSEFDRFLAERAVAADSLPDLPTVPCNEPRSGNGTPLNRSRQMKKDDQENALFAL